MNKKLLLTGAILGITAALTTACDSSSKKKKKAADVAKSELQLKIESFTQEAGVAECKNIGTLLTGDTINVGGVDKHQCVLPSRIGIDMTLTKDVVWVAGSKVKVGFGDSQIVAGDTQVLRDNAVTLNIEAGTELRSVPGGALVITRGSKINAAGTEADPITMSSLEQHDGEAISENYVGSGEWGGLVIQGFGMHNKCPNNSQDEVCNILGEGNVGYFGGNDNADNSGVLTYVIVAEGGEQVAPDNEINGITFQGVGNNTLVDYIQVKENQDDGVEFFGGAVNVKHLYLTGNQDDSIDWDEGYRGNIQFAYIYIDSSAGNAFETDNNGSSMDAEPRSLPTLSNITIESNGADGIRHREGTGAFMYNSVLKGLDFCLDVDDQATRNLVDTGLIYTNVYFDCTADVKAENEESSTDFGQAVVDSSVGNVVSGAVTLDGEKDANISVSAPDFSGASTANTGFLQATTYAGAVDGTNWWSSWAL